MIVSTLGHLCTALVRNRAVIAIVAFAAGAIAAHSIEAVAITAVAANDAIQWLGRALMLGGQ